MTKFVFLLVTFALALALVALAQSDAAIASVQQKLKDQGFYYGEVTGKKDADTTAAIRRYQIRNGLQVTGELNAETQKSLGLQGAATPVPRPSAPIAPRPAPTPETSDLLDDAPVRPQIPQTAPAEAEIVPEVHNMFAGTPYEVAPVEVQRRVILGAQSLLARRGLYRSTIDGEYGANTQFALRAFQSRFGLEPNGRFDMETLAALGLLPGQRAPGVVAPSRRGLRPPRPVMVAPNGEPIYDPR